MGRLGCCWETQLPRISPLICLCLGLKGKSYTKILEMDSNIYFSKLGQLLLLQLQSTKGDARAALEVHLIVQWLEWWPEAKVKEYRLRETILQKTSLLFPLDRQRLSLYRTLEVASVSKISHILKSSGNPQTILNQRQREIRTRNRLWH